MESAPFVVFCVLMISGNIIGFQNGSLGCVNFVLKKIPNKIHLIKKKRLLTFSFPDGSCYCFPQLYCLVHLLSFLPGQSPWSHLNLLTLWVHVSASPHMGSPCFGRAAHTLHTGVGFVSTPAQQPPQRPGNDMCPAGASVAVPYKQALRWDVSMGIARATERVTWT